MEENQGFEFDILDILKALYEGKFLIIALTVLLSLALGFYNYFNKGYSYTSTGTMYVSNINTELNNNIIESGDISTSRFLSSSYIEILRSRSFLVDVSDAIGGKVSAGALKGMLAISQVESTEFITITVTAGTAELAHDIVAAVMEKAPAKLISIYDGGTVKTLDEASLPSAPNGRGIQNDFLTGAGIGFVIGAAIIVVKRLLDRRIRNVADIEKRYEISILGEFPLV
ncbi:MAG: hypothetical protein KBS52_06260 [Clostridiales bacterium]|nr:hypothetical protein [Candidatus Equinaster intestinalis]